MADKPEDLRLPPLTQSVTSPRRRTERSDRTPRTHRSIPMSLPPLSSRSKQSDVPSVMYHSHVVYGSPLWHRDTVQTTVKPLPASPALRDLETGFVNDAVKTAIYSRPRKIPIIPDYYAERDKYARAYFKSPLVQDTMARASKEYDVAGTRKSGNKLSVRHRCRSTPNTSELAKMEREFVNDAIITEKKRTKYKDIIPPYDASRDKNARAYFMRQDVKHLLGVTRSAR